VLAIIRARPLADGQLQLLNHGIALGNAARAISAWSEPRAPTLQRGRDVQYHAASTRPMSDSYRAAASPPEWRRTRRGDCSTSAHRLRRSRRRNRLDDPAAWRRIGVFLAHESWHWPSLQPHAARSHARRGSLSRPGAARRSVAHVAPGSDRQVSANLAQAARLSADSRAAREREGREPRQRPSRSRSVELAARQATMTGHGAACASRHESHAECCAAARCRAR
jgi:hypothetical protein